MSDLLPINASAQERALSDAVARMAEMPVIVREVWNADTCPLAVLPWLAWAMSLDEWDASWSESQKRESVRQSIRIHRKKGTVDAVKRAMNAIFGSGTVLEWYEFGGDPHTFKIRTEALLPNDAAFRKLIALVTAAKPLRSHLTAIQLLRDSSREMTLGTGFHNARKMGVMNRVSVEGGDTSIRLGFAGHIANKTAVEAVTNL